MGKSSDKIKMAKLKNLSNLVRETEQGYCLDIKEGDFIRIVYNDYQRGGFVQFMHYIPRTRTLKIRLVTKYPLECHSTMLSTLALELDNQDILGYEVFPSQNLKQKKIKKL